MRTLTLVLPLLLTLTLTLTLTLRLVLTLMRMTRYRAPLTANSPWRSCFSLPTATFSSNFSG